MTEIVDKIKAKIERFGNRSMMFTRTEVAELLTTIESQASEIEGLETERDSIKRDYDSACEMSSANNKEALRLYDIVESQKEEIEKIGKWNLEVWAMTEGFKKDLDEAEILIDSANSQIESLKAITEQQNQDAKEANDHYREVARSLWDGNDCPDIDQIAVRFKVLSAITELAEKGLERVMQHAVTGSASFNIAVSVTKQIEKLKNE